jgi:hypothetical protein
MKREPVVEKPRPVRESRDVPTNAETAILSKESGRLRVLKRLQWLKSRSGIFVICDGGPNVTDDNLLHHANTNVHRVETEEGTAKEVRQKHLQKASESILRIMAGNLKVTVINSSHSSKHFPPMKRTLFGTVIERRCLQQ